MRLHGKGSTIITNNDYNRNLEWFFNISDVENVTIKDLKIKAMETTKTSYKSQVGIYRAKNITIEDCVFEIPNTTNREKWEWTNIDCYTNWENIKIQKSTFINHSDCERGCCLEIRDIKGNECKNIIVNKNTMNSNAHDEILDVFTLDNEASSIQNVEIKDNKITVEEGIKNRPSTMAMSMGYSSSHNISDVCVYKNEITAYTEHYLFAIGAIDQLDIRDNKIKYYQIGNKKDVCLFFIFNNYNLNGQQIRVRNNQININSIEKINQIYSNGILFEKNQIK